MATDNGEPSQIRAFITWFDTFFSSDSSSAGQAAPSQECSTEFFPDAAYEQAVEAKANAEGQADVSFTTGPRGKFTHWKQVVFMLRQPITLEKGECARLSLDTVSKPFNAGQRIKGVFNCIKGHDNARELDVEIHWRLVGEKGEDLSPINYEVFRVN